MINRIIGTNNSIKSGPMHRNLQEKLDIWKSSASRKPLVIKGARQVGKTYLLKTWGKQAFPRTHYINFEKTPQFSKVFKQDFDVSRILNEIGFLLQTTINPQTDLLILDEIQEAPRALTALKYFCEDLPDLAVCSAGSLLGVALSEESFPVGKVSFLHLYPMDFLEFLRAADKKDTWQRIPAPDLKAAIPEVMHTHLWEQLKIYYITGGMPEAVQAYVNHRDNLAQAFQKVRTLQTAIISSYEQDFAKHAGPVNSVHIQALFRNIPSQLAKVHDDSTKRFQFGDVLAGKKGFAVWERPLHWLINAGLVLQVKIVSESSQPLENFTQPNLFKLFWLDVGLLGCALDISPAALLDQDYGTAKGYFAENLVAQAMAATYSDRAPALYSWAQGTSQIEFVRHSGNTVMPIEVKAGHRTKAKSLTQYRQRYDPPLSVKISAHNLHYEEEHKLLHLPLYLSAWATALKSN